MLDPNVANFFRRVKTDSSLTAEVKNSDSYSTLAALSVRSDTPATEGELQAAFAARDAGVLLQHMIRRGLAEPIPMATIPPLDPELWRRVAEMDLTQPSTQLVTYRGWTPQQVASTERRYRRFFYLKAILPDGHAAPTIEVDEFWHQHIINTRLYGPDCDRVVGSFVHHTFLPSDDPAQAQKLTAVWLTTWVAYETLFHESYEETIGTALLSRWPNV
jgi:hypothetical protein